MIEIIAHQIVWVLISFFVFYISMHSFVFKKIEKLFQKRDGYIEKLNEQIDSIKNKAVFLEESAKKILYEEIPAKQKFYVEKTLEPVILELETEVLNEKQMLEEKLANKKVIHANFTHKLKEKTVLIKNAKDLINKVNA